MFWAQGIFRTCAWGPHGARPWCLASKSTPAAPDTAGTQRNGTAHAPHLVRDLVLHVLEEGGVGRVERAREHEVVPQHDPEPVRQRVEILRLVHLQRNVRGRWG